MLCNVRLTAGEYAGIRAAAIKINYTTTFDVMEFSAMHHMSKCHIIMPYSKTTLELTYKM